MVLLNREEIFTEINEERLRQDRKWGGPKHDDKHVPNEWANFIYDRTLEVNSDPMVFRKKMLQIAALAVAAIESYDRKNWPYEEDKNP